MMKRPYRFCFSEHECCCIIDGLGSLLEQYGIRVPTGSNANKTFEDGELDEIDMIKAMRQRLADRMKIGDAI